MKGFVTDPRSPAGLRLTSDLDEPRPAARDLVIDVRAYAINPGEARLIAARPEGFRPGQDIAGVVYATAEDGSGPPVGARVVARADWEGWAGQFAVQLAALSGARVTALVSGPDRVDAARALGADDVVVSVQQSRRRPFHVLLDGVGGPELRTAIHVLAPGGTAVVYGGVAGATELSLTDFYKSAWNARMVWLISELPEETKGADLATLVRLVAAGKLEPRIGWTADWTRTGDAFAGLANRQFRGKAVLTLDAD